MLESKLCQRCGRKMNWRKSWEKNWEAVKYCSDKCRQDKNRKTYEEEILQLVEARYPKTICPSEIRAAEQKSNKTIMESVRQSARKLAQLGKIEILQNSRTVDPENFQGPIRLRLRRI